MSAAFATTVLLLLLVLPSATPSVWPSSNKIPAKPLVAVTRTKSPYDRVLHAVQRSLDRARRTPPAVLRGSSSFSHVGGGDHDFCVDMVNEAVDYLDTARSKLSGGPNMLTSKLLDRVRSLTSAALTNVDTCLDGIVAEDDDHGTYDDAYEQLYDKQCRSLGLLSGALNWVGKSAPVEKFKGSRPGVLVRRIGNVPENQTFTVAKDGSGDFSSIQDAVNHAPKKPKHGHFKIIIKEGVYNENVLVKKKKIIMVGEGIGRTVITGNRSRGGGWNRTYDTATFAVHGERFIAYNMTFMNTAGPENHQAVAVRNKADFSVFYHCSIEGYQDTLYAYSFTQFYRDCDIYGTIDFIFGNAKAVFQNCNIYVLKPLPKQTNVITAQGRKCRHDHTGFSIHNSTIVVAPESDLSGTKTYLGRPWRPYSTTVYMESFLGKLIDPAGWLEYDGHVGLDTLYYGEFENYGPGSGTAKRVKWPGYHLLTVFQAEDFTVKELICGDAWLPCTHVPYTPGLLTREG